MATPRGSSGSTTRSLVARVEAADNGRLIVSSPGVGHWRGAPRSGDWLQPGAAVGSLECLGIVYELHLPEQAMGLVVQAPQSNARRHAVDFDASLLQLDPQNLGTAAPTEGPDQAGPSASAELVFRSPMSGRYYARPAPDKAPFLEVGQEIAKGETLCLLEVMKTFNRLTYAGDGLPKRAKIVAIIPSDGDDLNRGDPILELEVP